MKKFNPETKLGKDLSDEEKINYHLDYIENKSVLGIDIYKYSEYPEIAQVYVPVLFNSLYRITVQNCIKSENYFFGDYAKNENEFKEKFISTGDGGFQIFDNPMQSIIFASYFQLNVVRFNSNSFTAKLNNNLFDIIGRIELRYATTFDKIYSYDKNFFGPAIINNARILSKDNLNRFLIDFPTIKWFNEHINTIENLLVISKEDLAKIKYFNKHPKAQSLLFDDAENRRIVSLDILKIGVIKSKNTVLEIYNLKIQINLRAITSSKDYPRYLITLGNLNTQGIE